MNLPNPDSVSAEPLCCDICETGMAQVRPWLWFCGKCSLYSSNLEAGAGADITGIETLRRNNFDAVLERIGQYKKLASARMLDVGCSKGWFLEAALELGADVSAIEPHEENAKIAARTGAPVTIGFFPNDLQKDAQYDVITFNDVFEHLPEPGRMTQDISRALKPGGIVVVNLPNSDGFLYKLATILDRLGISSPHDRMWQKGLSSPHMRYFNPTNLRTLFENKSNLREVDQFFLSTTNRQGLWSRVRSTYPVLPAAFIYAAMWGLTFVLPLLPSDISVSVFQKPQS